MEVSEKRSAAAEPPSQSSSGGNALDLVLGGETELSSVCFEGSECCPVHEMRFHPLHPAPQHYLVPVTTLLQKQKVRRGVAGCPLAPWVLTHPAT